MIPLRPKLKPQRPALQSKKCANLKCNTLFYSQGVEEPPLSGKIYCGMECALLSNGYIRLQPNKTFNTEAEAIKFINEHGYQLWQVWHTVTDDQYSFSGIIKEPKKGDKPNEQPMASCKPKKPVSSVSADGLVPVRRPSNAVPSRPVKPPAQGTLW